jgi:hypothetical protein
VNTAREVQVAAAFLRRTATVPPGRLCDACIEALQVTGAGLTLMSDHHSLPVSASDPLAGELDELQFALGEGPSPDAYTCGAPVAEPDLERARGARWPTFTPPALQIGARGVFAFPLTAGDRHIGVLTLYRDTAGHLTDEQTADSIVVADLLALAMLDRQSRGSADTLADDISGSNLHRAEVHQASGMIAVQLGIDVSEALLRIRAHAYATDETVATVAVEIVARRLRLGDEPTS